MDTRASDRCAHRFGLAAVWIVHDDDVAAAEHRNQLRFDIDPEGVAVDRAVQDIRSVDPVMAQGANEDQLARIRPALMALAPLAAALRVQTVALVRDGRPFLEAVAEKPQSASDCITARRSAALGKQRLQSLHRDLRTGANARQNPITAAVQNRSAAPAHPVGLC